jgi:hypothetical protein
MIVGNRFPAVCYTIDLNLSTANIYKINDALYFLVGRFLTVMPRLQNIFFAEKANAPSYAYLPIYSAE